MARRLKPLQLLEVIVVALVVVAALVMRVLRQGHFLR
jgi:hypothetical protein